MHFGKHILVWLLSFWTVVAAGGDSHWHSSPEEWKEPRLYHLPFDEEFGSRISVGHCAVPNSLPDRHMADNNAYWFAPIFPDRTKPGIWNTDVLVYNERDYLVRIRLKNIHYCRDIGWVNEKLLRIRVWWGRICATDLIVDVEREQIIYKEMVWDGAIPYQQYQEANKASLAVVSASGNEQQPPTKTTSNEGLIELVKSGDLDSVRLTVDADKALANAKRADGVPLLYFAATNGHKDIVAYLLEMGASIDASTDYGSALHVATENEHEDVVRLLLDRGANPKLQNNWKMTPLHNTIQNQRETIARLLIDSGADINALDHKGRTPLHRCKSLSVAKLLISKGANPNAVNASGYTPLHWAATPREIVDRPTIEYLLTQGADVTRTDKAGLTPRQLAIKNGQNELVVILDEHKP